MPDILKKLLYPALLLTITYVGYAQSSGLSPNQWYFGNSTDGIIFNKSDNVANIVSNQFVPFGQGGSAVASDPVSGDLLFYTDGSSVFDASHSVMTNGSGLTANISGNQNVAVCGVPGEVDRYYIFTNSTVYNAAGDIRYTVVDMARFGNAIFPSPALGEVDNANKNQATGLSNTSEAMIIIAKFDRSGFWLISKQNGNNDIYEVLDIGSGTGNITSAGTFILGDPIIASNFSHNDFSGRIAVAPQNENRNIQILDFDNTTGSLSFNSDVLNSGYNNLSGQAIYDAEWSINGDYLYISVFGGGGFTGDLLQYDANTAGSTLLSILPGSVSNSYGLQMGPDSLLYHLYQSGPNILLGRIDSPDSVAVLTNYQLTPLGSIDFNGQQFPATLPPQDAMLSVNFTFSGICANVPTEFFPEITPIPDRVSWDFGDGTTSTDYSPIHTYDGQATPYNVILSAFLNGQSAFSAQTVNITPFDLQITLVSDTVACRDEFPPPRGTAMPGSEFSVTAQFQGTQMPVPNDIIWSNGDIGETLTPDSAGYYYLVATVGNCTMSAGVNVQEYGLIDQRSNVWYFGQNAGIDFNPLPNNPAVALDDSQMVANEGCTAISDRNGEILFYTDGSSVYDQNHVEIATNIGGSPDATQSVMVVPFPNDETLFYIFTNEAVHGSNTYQLMFSVFDLKQNGGTGAIIKDIVLLFTKSTERLISNGNWLIMHEYGNNTFRAYPISTNGIGQPILSSIGAVHESSIERNGHGYMELSSDGTRLALALSTDDNNNYIELFNFADSSGTVSNYVQIDLGADGATGQVYGIEFSGGGNKLLATVKNSGQSQIFEYRTDTLSKVKLIAGSPLPAFNGELGAMQTGPDGQTYIAINGSATLGTILIVDDTSTLSGPFQPLGFNLAGGTESRLGLPNFVQNQGTAGQLATIAITQPVCINNPVNLASTPTSIIDEFQWTILDASNNLMFTSTNQIDTWTPSVAGFYDVTLNITNRCALDTLLTQMIEVIDVPPAPEFNAVEIICQGSIDLVARSVIDPNETYLWSTGQTTRMITVTSPGNYSVTITNPGGCTSTASAFVNDAPLNFDLGPDLTACQNDVLPDFDVLIQGAGISYTWTINGANPSSSQTRSIDTSVPGLYQYIVIVNDSPPFDLCPETDTVNVTVISKPSVTAIATDSPGCGQNNGQIDIDIISTGSFTYELIGPLSTIVRNLAGPITVPSIIGLPIGTYSVIVTDEVSSCDSTFVLTISDVAATFNVLSAISIPGCTTVPVNIQLDIAPALPLNYTLTEVITGAVTGPTVQNALGLPPLGFQTIAVPPGSYTILIQDALNCQIITGPFTVTESAKAPASLVFDNCALTITGTTTTPNPFYFWQGPSGAVFTGQGTSQIGIDLTAGIYSLTVSDAAPNICDSTTTITVNPAASPSVIIQEQGNDCDGIKTLTANVTPTGNYNYLWLLNGAGFAQGQTVVATQTGDYSIAVTNLATNCSVTSTPSNVIVNQPIEVNIMSEPPCDTGNPFTISSDLGTTSPSLTISYRWFRNGQEINGQTQSTLAATQSGIYIVEAASTEGCTATATLDISVLPFDASELPLQVIICPAESDPLLSMADLDPGSNFVNYVWSNEGGTVISTDPVFTATAGGIYTVELTNAFGCMDRDTVRVLEDCIPKVFGPNAFKPSGINKEFLLFTEFLTDFEIFIYSRWGELVFQSNEKEFKWDGTLNGELLPAGTYAWVVKFKSEFNPDSDVMEQFGGVTLLR